LFHLGAISGNNRYLDLAKSGLKTLLRQIDAQPLVRGVGGFAGWGGVIYALSHLGVLLSDSSLAATAESLLDSLGDPIGLDKDLDIIGGAAGCAVALRSLQQTRPSVKVIETARACGERLLQTARQTDHGLGWIYLGNAESPLTGFAHGNAGIAYSLLTIAELTNEARFRQAACAAIEYERAVFSREHANWPDFRPNSNGGFVTAWCHGAPGIGLSRLCSLRFLDDPLLRDEIDTALATTSTSLGESHIVCHGDFGNVDILLYAAEILQEPRWRALAKHQAGRILTAAKGGKWVLENPLNVETPGLMTGLAGIGYVLLRLADPARVPCVLALESPKVQ
jgi:type 2 lantibiotic biosynthesis protein LanM